MRTEYFIRRKFWIQDLNEDLKLLISGCRTCNKRKYNLNDIGLLPWMPTAPGQIVFYDFRGPIFKRFYILCFICVVL